jgi:hypothetical protein
METWPFWIGVAIGLYMIWGGATKASSKPYFWLHKRAELLWKSNAHGFLMFSGIVAVGAMLFFISTS